MLGRPATSMDGPVHITGTILQSIQLCLRVWSSIYGCTKRINIKWMQLSLAASMA